MPRGAVLILESGFDPNGKFYCLPIHDTAPLTHLLRQRTVGLFLRLGLITEQFSETLFCWKHSGFSVDNSVRLDGGDNTARQALAQYIARAFLSLQKLTYDRSSGGKVLYHTSYNPYFRQNTNLWSATDFIAHLTQFIPRAAAALARREPAWARLRAKVYEIDPLRCPWCGSEMRLIAVITDPAEVRKILRHLLKIGRAPLGLDPSKLN